MDEQLRHLQQNWDHAVLTIVFGLLAAAAWGGSDFLGGLISRRLGVMLTVFLSEVIGLTMLLSAVPFVHEEALAPSSIAINLLAGGCGVCGLILLYRAMAHGPMSIAAPVSALLGAVVPVVVGTLTEGLPGVGAMAGFVLALAAVWLIAQGDLAPGAGSTRLADMRLPLLSGLCFGLYFVFMHLGAQQTTLWPLILARCVGTSVLSLLVWKQRHSLPALHALRAQPGLWKLVLPNAALDVGGSLFFVLAGQLGRMDVAAVLSALYPGGTVLLAGLFLKEKTNRAQTVGILAALVAIVLMTV